MKHVSTHSEAIIRFTDVSYRRLVAMRGMWRMLGSHHRGLIKLMGEKLRVEGYWRCGDWSRPNRWGGGCLCAWVVCSIPGSGLCWSAIVGVGGGFSGGELAGVPGLQLWGKKQKLCEGNGGCVLISICGTTSGTYTCLGLGHHTGRRCERGGVSWSLSVVLLAVLTCVWVCDITRVACVSVVVCPDFSL